MLTRCKKRKRTANQQQDVLNMLKELFLQLLDGETIQNLFCSCRFLYDSFNVKWRQKVIWELKYYLHGANIEKRSHIRKIEYQDADISFACNNLTEKNYLELMEIYNKIKAGKVTKLLDNTYELVLSVGDLVLISQLPPKLRKLGVDDCFQNVDHLFQTNLPDSLTELKFHNSDFNQPIILPPNLQTLDFHGCCEFNHKFKSLPPTLTVLALSANYSHKFDIGFLPNNLTSLKFGWAYYHIFEHDFFSNLQSLKVLKFKSFNQEFNIGFLPTSLIKLDLGEDFNQILKPKSLPPNLQYLHFDFGIQSDASFNRSIAYNVLPLSLTSLDLGNTYNQKIEPNILPLSLKRLCLGANEVKHNILHSNMEDFMFIFERLIVKASLLDFLKEFWTMKRETLPCSQYCDCIKLEKK